jgi:hypothetical protein
MTMLDHMLEVMYKQAQQTSIRNQMAEGLKHLPVSELKKLASGEMKLAYHDDDDWLCKFKGTPMYDDALQLETECLELDAKQQQMSLAENEERRARSNERDAIWDAKDAIRLKKRLLELDLRKAELAAAGGGEELEEPEEELEEEEEGEEEPEEDEKEAVASYFANKHRHEVMAKFAAELTQAGREHIKSKNFAIPKGNGPGDTGKYPIHDETHAKAALQMVAKNGTPEEKSKVYSAVAKKYPGLSARSSVEAVKEKAEEKNASALKFASADTLQVADLWGRQMARMEKEAGMGSAVMAGLKGAGKFIGAGVKGVGQVAGKQGFQAGLQSAGRVAAKGVQRAGQFAAKNSGAAAAIGGGALGTAALGGAALGRASA